MAQQWTNTASPTSDEVKVVTTLGRTSTYRSEAVDGGIRRTYSGPDGMTTTETTASNGVRSLVLGDGTKRTIGIAPSSAWGLDAPVLSPDVTTRPDGVVSTTTIAQDLKELNGLPYSLSGTITTTLNGAATVETFDPTSATTTVADPVGRKTTTTYDPTGISLRPPAPGSAPTTYAYDATGRVLSQTVGTGSAAQVMHWAYDSSTGTISMTRPDGKVVTTTVDANGRTGASAAPDGSTTIAAYDADGRLTQVQPPGGLSFVLGSSAAGRPTGFLPPQVGSDGSIEATTYDGDGQPAAVSGLGSRSIKYAYDAAGRLVGTAFDLGTASSAYDPSTGLLTQTVDPSGVTTVYGYAGSTPDSLTWSGPLNGAVQVSLDPNGRAVADTVDHGPSVGLTYDSSGELTGIGSLTLTRDPASGLTTASGIGPVQTSNEYDANERLIRSTTTVSGKVVDDARYTLDPLGRIVGVAETSSDGPTTTTAYTYDGADQLASVAVDGSVVETDTYDPAGNRTSVAKPSGSTTATYDARNQLVSWAGQTYSWLPDGSLAEIAGSGGKTTLSFDQLGRLRGVTPPSGQAITYLVDADGRRIGREVGGKLIAGYLYDPAGQVIAQTDGTGAIVEQFGYDDLGHLALIQRGSTSERVVTDPNGSPRLVIDASSGRIVDAIAYDPWGRITSESAPGTLPFGFGGGLADPDTGLVHFGARDYDPATGRWTASDPIKFAGGDPNLYRYSGDDPVNRTDPSGTASGCFDPWCGQAAWHGGNPHLHGCWGSACIRYCWDKCDPNPNDWFTCTGPYCNIRDCILKWCIGGDTHIYTGDGVTTTSRPRASSLRSGPRTAAWRSRSDRSRSSGANKSPSTPPSLHWLAATGSASTPTSPRSCS